ncbi:cob(I)yrinic acid a,c-diamide adenosyltransferase [Anaerohalosphaera lusitana]|nr:cob(I)yrinic acid a,c-diamide adenosyltransferase [Anaerohalosphaera lusitana]
MIEKGLVQIYTGAGKGKTTAAFGLAVRAAGHGNRVLIYQFLKPDSLVLGERKSAEKLGIEVRVLEHCWDMRRSLDDAAAVAEVREEVGAVLAEVGRLAAEKAYEVIVLDEIVFCVNSGLAEFAAVKEVVERRADGVEIVMTGRGASEELISAADLVTEMREVKHPFERGVGARKGIEF